MQNEPCLQRFDCLSCKLIYISKTNLHTAIVLDFGSTGIVLYDNKYYYTWEKWPVLEPTTYLYKPKWKNIEGAMKSIIKLMHALISQMA